MTDDSEALRDYIRRVVREELHAFEAEKVKAMEEVERQEQRRRRHIQAAVTGGYRGSKPANEMGLPPKIPSANPPGEQ